MSINEDFYKLFLVREGKELAGAKVKNIIGLFVILLLTFLSIGFGEGGLEYLKIKMDDPFHLWLNIPIRSNSNIGDVFDESLNNPEIKNHYHINRINQYSVFYSDFYSSSGSKIQVKGRTIEPSSPLLKKILENDNKVEGIKYEDKDTYLGAQRVGLIVSKDFLDKLNFGRSYPPFLNLYYPISLGSDKDLNVPLPIVAVVKQLPGYVSIISTDQFFQEIRGDNHAFNIADSLHQKYLRYFVPGKENASEIAKTLLNLVNSHWKGIVKDNFQVQEYRQSYQKGNFIQFDLTPSYLDQGIIADSLDQFVQNSGYSHKGKNSLYRIYNYDFQSFMSEDKQQDYISVEFANVDSISEFSQYVQRELKLEAEMSQIEAKKNFNFVSILTSIISSFLIIFSILSIVMFLNNLIKSHFERIKKNIGTFKAFGLDNKRLIITYSTISFMFVFFASAIAYLVAYCLGSFGIIRFLVTSSTGLALEKGYQYFDLNTGWSLYTFLSIIILSTLFVVIRLKRMLKQSPGNLVYER
jgi:hypothetical protein